MSVPLQARFGGAGSLSSDDFPLTRCSLTPVAGKAIFGSRKTGAPGCRLRLLPIAHEGAELTRRREGAADGMGRAKTLQGGQSAWPPEERGCSAFESCRRVSSARAAPLRPRRRSAVVAAILLIRWPNGSADGPPTPDRGPDQAVLEKAAFPEKGSWPGKTSGAGRT